jgi:hypothetical protein
MTRGSFAFFFLPLVLMSFLFTPLAFGQRNGPEVYLVPNEPPVCPQTISVGG